MVNVNPHLAVMEDKSILNAYSLLEPERHYRLRLDDQFMSFVEMTRGQLILDKERYYRHQACLYLTLNDRGQLRLNCLIMPSYADIQEGAKVYKLNVLPYCIDWNKYKNQQILKAVFIQIPTKNDNTMTLLVQLKAKVLVINLANGQMKSFETNSKVPLLLQHPDETSEAYMAAEAKAAASTHGGQTVGKTLTFYLHSIDGGA
jgi:hypothetical protein